jgi:hypothetical protein
MTIESIGIERAQRDGIGRGGGEGLGRATFLVTRKFNQDWAKAAHWLWFLRMAEKEQYSVSL